MADKTLDVLVRLGVIGKEDVEAVNALLAESAESTSALEKEMGVLRVTQEDVTKATQSSGEASASAREKHLLLHHAFAELNKIIPGLGTIVNAFERGLDRMGEAGPRAAAGLSAVGTGAEAAGAGCAAAEPAAASLIATLGPLIIIMEAVQLATQLWDLHTEKVKQAAEAQAEAYKQIEEASKKAMEAQLALDEALNPKPNAVKGLEKELHDKERDIKNQAERQKETNKAAEAEELAGATTPEQKDAIKKKWAARNQDVDERAEHATVGAKNAAVAHAESEIGANTKKSDADKAAAGAAIRKAAQDENEAQNNYDRAPVGQRDALGEKLEAAKAATEKARAEIKRLDEEAAKLDTESAAIVGFRDKTRDAAGEDQTNSSFRRGTRKQVDQIHQKTDQEEAARNFTPTAPGHAEHLNTLQQLEALTGKNEAQKAAILQKIIAHQITAQQAWTAMEAQLEQLQSQRHTAP